MNVNPDSGGVYECKLETMKPMIASKRKSLKVLAAPEKKTNNFRI